MLQQDQIDKLLHHALACRFDYAEIFFDRQYTIKSTLINGEISALRSGADVGIGVRLFKNKKIFYISTNQGSYESLIRSINELSDRAVNRENPAVVLPVNETIDISESSVTMPILHKNDMILCIQDATARAQIKQHSTMRVKVIGTQKSQYVEIYNSEGISATDARHYTRIYCEVIYEHLGCLARGISSFGQMSAWRSDMFDTINQTVFQAVEQSKTHLQSRPMQSGHFPVVLGCGSGGVIFHEACGHLLESASLTKKPSLFKDRFNTNVAIDKLSLIDEGNLKGAWGSLKVDDEGKPTQKNYLIKKGILTAFLMDKLGALVTGHPCTGSARRESYRYLPEARMTNTYIESGHDTFSDIMASVDNGIYVKQVGSGFVEPETGEFQFSVIEGYYIHKGKILYPLKGMHVSSNALRVLEKISMIGDDFAHECGLCASYSGIVPTTVGQPTIKVDDMKVIAL